MHVESRYSSVRVVQQTFTFPPGEDSAYQISQTNFQSVHQVPITTGWPKTMYIQILPKDFIHDQCAGNRPQDLSLSGPTPYCARQNEMTPSF